MDPGKIAFGKFDVSFKLIENIFVQMRNCNYFYTNMSTPLPVRSGRLGWTLYYYTYAQSTI
jgi:hypothetical protein